MHVIHCTEHVEDPLDFVSEPIAHDLAMRPQRPGHLCMPLTIPISPSEAIIAAAKEARIPLELYAVLTVEVAHAAEVAAATIGHSKDVLLEDLERRIRHEERRRELTTEFARPLEEYARALEQGTQHVTCTRSRFVCLTLTQEQAAAWTRAALAVCEPVDQWVGRHLERPIGDVHLIEAQAARRGLTLREWVALEAARLCRLYARDETR